MRGYISPFCSWGGRYDCNFKYAILHWNVDWFLLCTKGCSLLFVCISSNDAKCLPIWFNVVWLNNLLSMYFILIAVLWNCILHSCFCFIPPYFYYVNCVPRVCLYGALPHEVCVCLLNLPTLPKDWHFTVQCLFMHCSTHGWPLTQAVRSVPLSGSADNKNRHIPFVVFCHVCIWFSCQIKHSQVQGQVQVH